MYFLSFILLSLCFASSQVLGKVGQCGGLRISHFKDCTCDPVKLYNNGTLRYLKVPKDATFDGVTNMFQYNKRVAYGTFESTIFWKKETSTKHTVFAHQLRMFHDGNSKLLSRPANPEDPDMEFFLEILWCDSTAIYFSMCSPQGIQGGADYRFVSSTTGVLNAEQKKKIHELDQLNLFKGELVDIPCE